MGQASERVCAVAERETKHAPHTKTRCTAQGSDKVKSLTQDNEYDPRIVLSDSELLKLVTNEHLPHLESFFSQKFPFLLTVRAS